MDRKGALAVLLTAAACGGGRLLRRRRSLSRHHPLCQGLSVLSLVHRFPSLANNLALGRRDGHERGGEAGDRGRAG